MNFASKLFLPAAFAVSVMSFTSCGPSTQTINGFDYSFTAPGRVQVSNEEISPRRAVNSCLYLVDDNGDGVAQVEVIYANLNPQYVLEDYYGTEAEPGETAGTFVSCTEGGNVYAFNQDSCTVVLSLYDETLTPADFTDWKINHDYDFAASKCDHDPKNDRPFLYETYGKFSPNIDYALTDDYITMNRFQYDPEKNIVDVVILLRNKSKDGYMAHQETNDEYIASRVMAFASGTGLYGTYCRSKEAPVVIRVYDTWGEELPSITRTLAPEIF